MDELDPNRLLANIGKLRYSLHNNNFDRHIWWILFRAQDTISSRLYYYEDWRY